MILKIDQYKKLYPNDGLQSKWFINESNSIQLS